MEFTRFRSVSDLPFCNPNGIPRFSQVYYERKESLFNGESDFRENMICDNLRDFALVMDKKA